MNEDFEKQLAAQFPVLFTEYGGDPYQTCMSRGCEHYDGWNHITRSLCLAIQSYLDQHPDVTPVVFEQIKEKFGALRVYHRGGDDFVDCLINAHAAMSVITCESCGKPGTLLTIGFWYLTRCAPCFFRENLQRATSSSESQTPDAPEDPV